MSRPTIAVLGAGPAGLGAAWQLRKHDKADVIVLERGNVVGGNAGSFELAGFSVDYGSHRLHPACDEHILRDLNELLGDDLLDRPRHGRIRLKGRWIHFPLKPLDLMTQLPFSFSLGVARDVLGKVFGRSHGATADTFEAVLRRGLGATICSEFYLPYAEKIWGRPPSTLSAVQARRRVAAGSLGKIFLKVFGAVPGFRPRGKGRFYYPRKGYGQICTAIADAAGGLGADIRLQSTVSRVECGRPCRVEIERDGERETFEADYVWSTLPISLLARLVQPSAPEAVRRAADNISYRAMILIYLVLGRRQFTPFDAHYLPEADVPITRLSEPRNYADRQFPDDRTVLCAELPCDVGDAHWTTSDASLAELVTQSIERCGLRIDAPILEVATRRLPHAYPIYAYDYDEHFSVLDQWSTALERVLTFGRQGLFAHDNTHHALTMAYAAVDCLDASGAFDANRWANYRREFQSHVVED